MNDSTVIPEVVPEIVEENEAPMDRAVYDAVDLKDCAAAKCSFLAKTSGVPSTVSCTVAAVSLCPAVIDSKNLDLTSAKEYIGEVTSTAKTAGQVSSPGMKEYEVWCREVIEDSAVILAESLEDAHSEAGKMVSQGQLYPFSNTNDVLFGAREMDEPESTLTLICDHLGEITVMHASGPIDVVTRELRGAQYEIIAAFRGKHEDVLT